MVVKLKKYLISITHFVLILTFALSISCGSTHRVDRIVGTDLTITDEKGEKREIENFITPYREHIASDLNTVLAYSPQTIDKSGRWQTPMGNLFSDVVIKMADPIFFAREKQHIAICLLNHGGVRSIIAKGDITVRTAFEIMPFENSLVIVMLKGNQILEMVHYIIDEKKPHPLSGLTFTIDSNNQPQNMMIQGKPFDIEATYSVATNDYLYNGGDNMTFFKKGVQMFDLDYKLRNILIDYFKSVDTVEAPTDIRIRMQ